MNVTPLLDFADREYVFDRKTGRYRWASGANKGKFAPREAVLALTEQVIADQQRELVKLADLLEFGKITLLDFQTRSAEILRVIHTSSAILGRGGLDRMTSEDWLEVGRTLKVQYYAGIDPETGRRFGLQHLASEIQQGLVSAPQLRNRLTLYSQSGMLSYWAMFLHSEEQDNRTFAVRELNLAAANCEDCIRLSQLPPQPVSQVFLPGIGCRCRMACHCRIRTLSLQEAIAVRL